LRGEIKNAEKAEATAKKELEFKTVRINKIKFSSSAYNQDNFEASRRSVYKN